MRRFVTWIGLLALIASCDSAVSVDANTLPPVSDGPSIDPGEDPEDDLGDDPLPAIELPISARNFDVGVSGFIARNWPNPSDGDWQDLFAKLPEYGELFGVHAGWNDDPTDDGIPTTVELAFLVTANTPMRPYVGLGFEPDVLTQEEADAYFDVHGDDFVRVATAVARKHRPGILLLGVEVNRYFEKSEAGFERFVQVYESAYDSIKAASPETKVAPNFLYESLIGEARRAGGAREPHVELIDRFGDRIDLHTVTLYPWLHYDTPGDVPGDYLDRLAGRPLMITETGWPSGDFPHAEVDASEQAQIDYLIRMLDVTRSLTMEALIWVYPHDPNVGIAGGVFDRISMRENEGTTKPVFEYWEALRDLR